MKTSHHAYGMWLAIAVSAAGCIGNVDTDGTTQPGSATSALRTGMAIIPSTGQSFDIEILQPSDGATVPEGEVVVSGRVSIGGGQGSTYNVLTVVDVSGSTASPSGLDCNADGLRNAGDNYNADATYGDVLDCEIAGALALNDYLHNRAGIDVGLIVFGSSATIGDMRPTTGSQPFLSPAHVDANGSGTPDFNDVVRSLDQGTVARFTAASVSTGTNFNAALVSMNAAFATQPAGETNVALFFSDGQATVSDTNILAAANAGTTIYTFSVGTASTGCGPTSALRRIADLTGGVCTQVSNPADLPPVVRSIQLAGVDAVEVNGTATSIDLLGNFSSTLQCAAGQTLDIVTTGFASDPDATQVSANISVDCCADADQDRVCDPVAQCTVPPVISCNASTFTALPAVFTPTATGECGATTTEITSYKCLLLQPGGRIRDVTANCTVSTAGGVIAVANPYGKRGHVTWTTRSIDAEGNAATADCTANFQLP